MNSDCDLVEINQLAACNEVVGVCVSKALYINGVLQGTAT